MSVPKCPGCRALLARLAQAEAKILALEGQVRDLLDKLKPPQPPRAITPQPPAPAKTPTGRKPGGQPDHPPHLKVLVPAERVKQFVPYLPEHCSKCHKPLSKVAGAKDPDPRRHQVAELPPLAVEITEHQAHGRTCACGEVTWPRRRFSRRRRLLPWRHRDLLLVVARVTYCVLVFADVLSNWLLWRKCPTRFLQNGVSAKQAAAV